jgi:hypothetical protein
VAAVAAVVDTAAAAVVTAAAVAIWEEEEGEVFAVAEVEASGAAVVGAFEVAAPRP